MATSFRLGVPQGAANYNVRRNIFQSIPKRAIVSRPVDPWRLVAAARYRMSGGCVPSEQFRFAYPFFPRVDLLHFFNTVSSVRTPWITTFESVVPRWHDLPKDAFARGAMLLVRPSCRRLLAMSDSARNNAALCWKRVLDVESYATVLGKVEVMLPPQPILSAPSPRRGNDRTNFFFVGNDFYRKGGLEFLEALARLCESDNARWHATIVGNLDHMDDGISRAGEMERQRAKGLLARLGDRVEHHASLPNSEVLARFKQSDFHVLPTLSDTFGYSVLEAQACGSVVISTNVRALPEIVRPEFGMMHCFPLDEAGYAHSLPDFSQARRTLVAGLAALLAAACALPETDRVRMATMAQDNLRDRHCPAKHARAMDRIYAEALH